MFKLVTWVIGRTRDGAANEKLLAFGRICSKAELWPDRIIPTETGKDTRERREIREKQTGNWKEQDGHKARANKQVWIAEGSGVNWRYLPLAPWEDHD